MSAFYCLNQANATQAYIMGNTYSDFYTYYTY